MWLALAAWGGGLLLFAGTAIMAQWLADTSVVRAAQLTTLSPSLFLESNALPIAPNIPLLQHFMLSLINQNRQANGLPEVKPDSIAAAAGINHAAELARVGYASHWNMAGLGPDHRYTLAGGRYAVTENIYVQQLRPEDVPTTPEQWQALVRRGQQMLMNSPTHRRNILWPNHTHVGVGIAYYPATGWLVITQEFTNQYVTLQALPQQILPGQTLTVAGNLSPNTSNPLLNLAFEPLPQPLDIARLNAADSYVSAAKNYKSILLSTDSHGHFKQRLTLNNQGQSGLYHIRIWVDTPAGKTLAVDSVVKVIF